MDVHYITMRFPVRSEAFAGVEVRALQRAGAAVTVHCLRIPMRGAEAESIMRDWRLERLRITGNSFSRTLAGIKNFVIHPLVGLDLLARIIACSWRNPGHLVKSFLLMPRAIDTFFDIPFDKTVVVHLFWGHFPSLVGYLFLRWRRDCVVSIFLGAYDLLSGFGLSVYVANRADVVWTHTKANLKAFEKLGIATDMLRVSYRGIDLSSIPAHMQKVPHRIVTAGRLISAKNMHEVLHVFAQVLKLWGDAVLVVIGDGPELANLRTLAGKLGIGQSVFFRGYLNHTRVYEECAMAQVFILLSDSPSERLPNVVKEAMACRCVCIVSDTPGIEELIEGGSSGFIVGDDRIDESARYIDMIFNDDKARESLAKCAEERILGSFNASLLAAERVRVWAGLLQGKCSAASDYQN